MKPLTLSHLKSINRGFDRLFNKRLSISFDTYDKFLLKIAEPSFMLITNIEQLMNSVSDDVKLNPLIKILRRLIKFVLQIIHSRPSSNNFPSSIETMSYKIFVKIKDFINLYSRLENNQVVISDSFKLNIKKSGVALSLEFMKVIVNTPSVLIDRLEEISVSLYEMFTNDFKSIKMTKITSLLLLKLISCFVFYSKPDSLESKNIHKTHKVEEERQSRACSQYYKVFNNELAVSNMMYKIIHCLLQNSNSLINSSNSPSLEILIEENECDIAIIAGDEIETPLSKIGYLLFEQLLSRFTDISRSLYIQLINEVVYNNKITDIQHINAIFIPLNALVKVLVKNQDDLKIINFNDIFMFLINLSNNNIILVRRSMIVMKIMSNNLNLEPSQIHNFIKYCLMVEKLQDLPSKFWILENISIMIQKTGKGQISDEWFKDTLKISTYIFIELLSSTKNPNLHWKLGKYYSNVLEYLYPLFGNLTR